MERHEQDPTGRAPNEPGAKLDQGKIRVGLMMQGFPRALHAVSEVTTFGAQKYTPGGWVTVPNGIERYTDAMFRHLLDMDAVDEDSGLSHLAHAAWNVLAILELKLREHETRNNLLNGYKQAIEERSPLREDAQSVSGWDTRYMVFGEGGGLVGGVQIPPKSLTEE